MVFLYSRQHWGGTFMTEAETTRRSHLPTFICAGAQKSGTTWLYHQLCQHPQIRMPKVKELRYFHPWNGEDWQAYQQHFRDCQGFVCGEMTPEYLFSKTAPAQMKERLPQLKVFAILRNPTERAFSQWRMGRHLGNMDKAQTFLSLFWRNKNCLRGQGHYATHIKTYTSYFPLGRQFQYYFYDDLVADPVSFYGSICSFLCIEPIIPVTIHNRLENAHKDDGLTMTTEERQQLAGHYRPHIEELEALSGRSLKDWKSGGGNHVN
jgi:hypothetical protein